MNDALAALEDGRVVAAATESLVGLLADATRADALDTLFAIKPRGAGQGVPLILPGRDAWHGLVREVPEPAARLAARFWPGPLSIALPAGGQVDPRLLLAGTIAVRLPGACAAARLAARFGRPLTATSANLHGCPPATSSLEVRRQLDRATSSGLLFVVEGTAPGGPPSTVVVVADGSVRVAREGAVERSEIDREFR